MKPRTIVALVALVSVWCFCAGWLASASRTPEVRSVQTCARYGDNGTICVESKPDGSTEAIVYPESWDTLAIEEDEPGWNCAEMGNRICGPR